MSKCRPLAQGARRSPQTERKFPRTAVTARAPRESRGRLSAVAPIVSPLPFFEDSGAPIELVDSAPRSPHCERVSDSRARAWSMRRSLGVEAPPSARELSPASDRDGHGALLQQRIPPNASTAGRARHGELARCRAPSSAENVPNSSRKECRTPANGGCARRASPSALACRARPARPAAGADRRLIPVRPFLRRVASRLASAVHFSLVLPRPAAIR